MAHVNRECCNCNYHYNEAFLKKYRDIGNRETALQFAGLLEKELLMSGQKAR
jgi:hypothetical protein